MVRRLATIATLAALTLAALPAGASAQEDCQEAQDDFWMTWDAEAHQLTRPVALAARAVVDACPQEEPATAEGEENPLNDLHRTVLETANGAVATAREVLLGRADAQPYADGKTMAALCGFTGAAATDPTRATLQGWIMVGSVMENGTDLGTGTATFNAATGYTRVTATGSVWGVDVDSAKTGTLYFHGVPFPLYGHPPKNDVVQASAGCGIPPGPKLCWGDGYGWTAIGPLGSISVAGYFFDCH